MTVLEGCKPAIVMKLYAQGSLAAAIEARQGQGLELKQALRWAAVWEGVGVGGQRRCGGTIQ